MNRNVAIVITILVLAIIAGYLVWLRSRLTPQISTQIQKVDQIKETSPMPTATAMATLLPSPTASASASPSASVKGKVLLPTPTPKK